MPLVVDFGSKLLTEFFNLVNSKYRKRLWKTKTDK